MMKQMFIWFWLLWQEATITNQLDAGVRYFDLRIARKPNDPDPTRLYFYHGLYTRTDVEVKTRNDYQSESDQSTL